MRSKWTAAALAAALVSGSCSTIGPGDNVTETFSATLQPFIGDFHEHPFNVGKTGEYALKIASLTPAANVPLVVYLGTPSEFGCQVIQRSLIAYPGLTALSSSIRKGTWCVGVADGGTLKQAETYVLEVSHP